MVEVTSGSLISVAKTKHKVKGRPMLLSKQSTKVCSLNTNGIYRIIPIKGTPHSLKQSILVRFHKNDHSFLNIGPIFNPKPPLESSECQLSPYAHVLAPGAFIRDNTVDKDVGLWRLRCAPPQRYRATGVMLDLSYVVQYRMY